MIKGKCILSTSMKMSNEKKKKGGMGWKQGWDGMGGDEVRWHGMGSAFSLVNSFENWGAARLITECAVTRFARGGVATFFGYQPLDRRPLDRRVLYGSPVSTHPFCQTYWE
jgi:hypothetical protein